MFICLTSYFMPTIKIDDLEHNKKKLSFTVSVEEAQPHLEDAAKRLSETTSIPGFRPGKAGYDIIKSRFGEMKLYEEALDSIIRSSFVQAILDHKLDTVGSPKIDVETLAPGNDIVFTAEVTMMPKVERLADVKKLKVEAKPVEVKQEQIDLALKDLTRMQTKEIRGKEGEKVAENDKIVVKMEMKKDGVAVEGGSSENHAIFLTEEYYIPGLKEQVVGLGEGETKTFALTFPEEHVQKHLAGSEVEFTITIKELYHLEPPALDDALATSLGVESFAKLTELISENLKREAEAEEEQRQEKEVLELLANKSRFEEIPDLLLNEEIHKMMSELQRAVTSQGADFDEYLKNIGKTLADMKIDFTPQALMRIKVALVMREVAEKEGIVADEKEVDAEIDKIAEQYKDNEEVRNQLFSAQYRDYTQQIIRNRNVIGYLKQAMVK